MAAYVGPAALLNMLYHNEPFGPIDTIVVVDHLEELITEMNIANGCLVSSIASDDPKTAKTLAEQLRGFQVGVNTMRSRGDREEPFGGIGQSSKGCLWVASTWCNRLRKARPERSCTATFPITHYCRKKVCGQPPPIYKSPRMNLLRPPRHPTGSER